MDVTVSLTRAQQRAVEADLAESRDLHDGQETIAGRVQAIVSHALDARVAERRAGDEAVTKQVLADAFSQASPEVRASVAASLGITTSEQA